MLVVYSVSVEWVHPCKGINTPEGEKLLFFQWIMVSIEYIRFQLKIAQISSEAPFFRGGF